MRVNDLFEAVQPLPSDMPIEDMLEALERRFAAARRGLSFAHRVKNPLQKKKHMASVLTNMNVIRGQLTRVINQMEQFNKAEDDYSSDEGPDDLKKWHDTSAELK